MRIALIEPRAGGEPIFGKLSLPRVGLCLLGTILRDRGHAVEVFSEPVTLIGPEQAAQVLSADLVGISCISATAPRAYAMSAALRRRGIPVVLGGVHPTFCPEEAAQFADYVITGQAEESLPALVAALEAGGDVSSVPNLCYRRDGALTWTSQQPMGLSPDELPVPDFGLVADAMRMGVVPMVTSRGCPHNCTFCTVTAMFGRRVAARSPERVIEDIERYGCGRFVFWDDDFAAIPERAKEILRQALRRGIVPAGWAAQVRADACRDGELLDLMARTNCRRLFIGFESLEQSALDWFGKRLSAALARECVASLHERGIAVHGMFVFGDDTQDAAACRATVQFALAHQIDTAQFLVLTPLPGSQLFRQMEAEGRILTRDWSLYDAHHVVFQPARMSPRELQMEAVHAQAAFSSARSALRAAMARRRLAARVRFAGRHWAQRWLRANRAFLARLPDRRGEPSGLPEQFCVEAQELSWLSLERR